MRKSLAWQLYPIFLITVLAGVIGIAVLQQISQNIFFRALLGGAFISVLGLLTGFIISRRIGRPLRDISETVALFSSGHLERRLPTDKSHEIAVLSDALNSMAARLDERIRLISRQRNEQEAVFHSMIEGVLAIDDRERLININDAAASMLGLHKSQAVGRFIQEVVRNTRLQKLISTALDGSESIEDEIGFQSNVPRVVRVHASVLRGHDDAPLGVLIVLNDITRIRQLENIRRDFVANVSHELKTPITSIKGFVETLRGGALQSPDDAERFLAIIARQTDRLNSIIVDLLSLSKIEEDAQRQKIELEDARLRDILASAVQACELKAKNRNVAMVVSCHEAVRADVNPQLLEQALVNLIDNAIKYSDAGGKIEIGCHNSDNEIIIWVKDHGCGIEKRHLPRLFERFYRADKARSRELGGTGLGLAIVKHIGLAHGGRADVESTLGKGSTFRIYLPYRPLADSTKSP
jgi:two-component system phosphate regulon sensor histidine kinase PhoR